MSEGKRKCPYCGKSLVKHPYWRHIETEHPEEYKNDRDTWIQLYKDYSGMGMDQSMCITVISELFNQSADDVTEFLKKNKII